ncbi:MAG: TatD family hydrolase [Alicyclobacillus sp.]|nr:TatD family hydrolase [Alicyclobacillus sp.]
MLIDTHCHLADPAFAEDVDAVLERAAAAGVDQFVVPAVDLPTSEKVLRLAERYPQVYAAVGVHPESLADLPAGWLDEVRAYARHDKVVAIGEIGLDYYWDVAPRPVQQEVFAAQMALAAEMDLPVIVHNRDATADTVARVESAPAELRGVMHCFMDTLETANRCIARGFYISFGGPVTFRNARAVQETAAGVDDRWLLVETDAPYLSPHPFRGKRNEPARVRLVAERLAELRGTSLDDVARATTENAHRLFPRLRAGVDARG